MLILKKTNSKRQKSMQNYPGVRELRSTSRINEPLWEKCITFFNNKDPEAPIYICAGLIKALFSAKTWVLLDSPSTGSSECMKGSLDNQVIVERTKVTPWQQNGGQVSQR